MGTTTKHFDFNHNEWPPKDWTGDRTRIRIYSPVIPFDSGSFRDVYMGYDSKSNQNVVAKKFKDGHPKSSAFWTQDLTASKRAHEYALQWNSSIGTNKQIEFVQPLIDYAARSFSDFEHSECILIEPYLGSDYKKFSSNSGYLNSNCGLSMSTFSHFTYHMSNGHELVCDLQGVKLPNKYMLTDPVICSTQCQYGVTDLGSHGIAAFFSYHKCTDLCNPSWKVYHGAKPPASFKTIQGTTFRL